MKMKIMQRYFNYLTRNGFDVEDFYNITITKYDIKFQGNKSNKNQRKYELLLKATGVYDDGFIYIKKRRIIIVLA